LERFLHFLLTRLFSARTATLVEIDLLRARTRLARVFSYRVEPRCDRLHLGCGSRHVSGWLNVDVSGSDYDVDIASGRLPWKDDMFNAVVAQHLIEHLDIRTELLPFFAELNRVMVPGGEAWLSCPDIEKICRSYLQSRMSDLLEDRIERWPEYSLGEIPVVHLINDLFHQWGEHKNLFDFELLEWSLRNAGFVEIERVSEASLLRGHPGFPPRLDDLQALHVRALAGQGGHSLR